MHPKGGIPPPQGSSNTVEQMIGGVLWANPLGNGLPKRPDDVDGVLRNVSATMGMNSTPADRHPARCDVSLRWTPTYMDQFSSIILRVCTLEPLSEDGPVIKHIN